MSVATVCRFNQEAYSRLAAFETWVKQQLTGGPLLHVDETGINVNGKRRWLHVACTERLTWLAPHDKRGTQAMAAIGIVPNFTGVLCHDHWKPYYTYKDCQHSLCNAHHLRELERASEQDSQRWAGQLKDLLLELNQAVNNAGGRLSAWRAIAWRLLYRDVWVAAELECPPPEIRPPDGKRGRPKRSKARNLLERLRTFESDVLRFMSDTPVPFTNNPGESDLRMTKVQQKISGCFRSNDGAETFCRVRSYLATCRKNGVPASEALALLFRNDWPAFMLESGILGCGAAE